MSKKKKELTKEELIEQRNVLVDYWKDEILFMEVRNKFKSLFVEEIELELRKLSALGQLAQYNEGAKTDDKKDSIK